MTSDSTTPESSPLRDPHSRVRTDPLVEADGARLAAIVASAHVAILGKKLDGTITSWNLGAEMMYGYTAEEAVGRSIELIIPPERTGEMGPVYTELRRRRTVAPFETVRVRKDGKRLHVLLTVSPVVDADGHLVAASAVAYDITEAKNAQRRLERTDRERTDFLAVLGHELRNPLAGIDFGCQLLESGVRDPAWILDAMRKDITVMTRLLNDLLDISRIGRGRIDLQLVAVEIGPLVRRATEAVTRLRDKEHRVVLSAPSRPLFVEGDPVRLEQVFVNLFENAAKYTAPGGTIDVCMERHDDTVVVTVRDDGLGIDPDTLEEIFEPFARGTTSHDGLGVGLSLVRKLVELHGGTVEASSPGIGQGSEFVVRLRLLPALAATKEEEAAEGAAAPWRAEELDLLLVEDNPVVSRPLATLLALAGFRVETAETGAEALRLAEERAPDVVVLDLGLPDIDGYAVARALRASGTDRPAVIVAVTGVAGAADIEKSRDAGIDAHIVKPVHHRRILQAIATALDAAPAPPRDRGT